MATQLERTQSWLALHSVSAEHDRAATAGAGAGGGGAGAIATAGAPGPGTPSRGGDSRPEGLRRTGAGITPGPGVFPGWQVTGKEIHRGEDAMTLSERFSHNMKQERRRKRLSQTQLGKRAGVSTSYVSMLERNQRTPPLDTLEKIARALQIRPVQLLH
jgi:DNA-binding XRE family transcriptional regulator